VLNFRPGTETGFGFWPRLAEWRIGLTWFVLLLPPVFALNALVGFARVGLPDQPPLRAAALALGTFFGILWVVALSEELIFRGLLQRWLAEAWGRPRAALLVSSLLFGAVHLGFRGFPNWKFALLAALAGAGYGLAFDQARGIRAPMVAHAALVTVWRLFLR
jgi:membrane protease YdiL (CAAX protease family)